MRLIRNFIKLKETEEDYKGEHTAPDKESGSPLYDVTLNGIYPEDIYSNNALQYYGAGESYDYESISIINSYRNRPNRPITIYRAVPDLNKKENQEIKDLVDILNYKHKFGFFPFSGNKKSYNMSFKKIRDKHDEEFQSSENMSYDEYDTILYKKINDKISELKSQLKKPFKINKGDWVTISKQYAIDHGRHSLNNNYKITQKSVYARDIYTDGNSIHEWGYDPQPRVNIVKQVTN